MKGWLPLITWTVLLYLLGVYIYVGWQRKVRQSQSRLWRQVGFKPDFNHQARKTGLAISRPARQIALRDRNNLGIFEPGDIVSVRKRDEPGQGARVQYFIDLQLKDPRKSDWPVTFKGDRAQRDQFLGHLETMLSGPGAPAVAANDPPPPAGQSGQ